MAHMMRTDVTFDSGGESCAAWLYLPERARRATVPMIVMGHGLGAVRQMRLDAFAERFAAAGYGCLVFDYRHFGDSEGEPRQLLDIGKQLEDWEAAIASARTIDWVDPDRVVAWGTSFGGGHVITTAARDTGLAAVISQCPFTDGIASARTSSLMTSAKITALAVRDVVGSRLGRPPVMVATFGPPGTTALMNQPDSVEGVLALVPEGADIRADVAARFALNLARYWPGRQTSKVSCPILFVVCELDNVAPSEATLRHAKRAPRGEIIRYDAGHFDIYVGEDFERNVADQLEFLARHVPLSDGRH
jgi:pimeloyl-ACP methyl ester carboxylesterase